MSIMVWGLLMTTARMAIAALSQSPLFGSFAERCWVFFTRLTDSYQPEKHYMRGPGPKCREKAAARG
jgi:hypothetical protein